MNRDEIIWILECCMLSLDGISKKEILSYGCPNKLADSGIQLYNYLSKKKPLIIMEVDNGC